MLMPGIRLQRLVHGRIAFAFGMFLFTLLMPSGVMAHARGSAELEALQITSASWDTAPSYGKFAATVRPKVLYDGKIERHPAWVRRDTATWVNRSVVRLDISVADSLSEERFYRLYMHVGRSSAAGVNLPRRVDVYCLDAAGSRAWHVGSAEVLQDAIEDKSSGWIAVPARGCRTESLSLIIHARGAFLVLDEIRLYAEKGRTGPLLSSMPVFDISPKADSVNRLKQQLLGQRKTRILTWANRQRLEGITAWLEPAFADLGNVEDLDHAQLTRNTLDIVVSGDRSASFVIGVFNSRPVSGKVSVMAAGAATGHLSFRRLHPVLAADGRLVFDALGKPANSLILDPLEFGYLWGVLESRQRHETAKIEVADDEAQITTLAVRVSKVALNSKDRSGQMHAFVWAYERDRPIWRDDNKEQLARLLADAGVDVFVVHPSRLPPLGMAPADWDRQGLVSSLRLFKDKGLLLIFPNWHARAARGRLDADIDEQNLRRWLGQLREALAEAGIAGDQWALYPVDEPRGASLRWAVDLMKHLRAIDPSIKFYLNPIAPKRTDWQYRKLIREARKYVNFWQPRAGVAFRSVAEMTATTKSRHLWLYDNPQSPAKSWPPFCYWGLPLVAETAGASGVGFWSFSATDGSSAWDDFDGDRPDWAVVYEDPQGVALSRRWLAFVAGLEDARIRRACRAQSNTLDCVEFIASLPVRDRDRCYSWR